MSEQAKSTIGYLSNSGDSCFSFVYIAPGNRVLQHSTVPVVDIVSVPLISLITFNCTSSPNSKLGTESSHLTPHANCSIMSRSIGVVPWRFEACKRYQIISSGRTL